MAQNSVDVGALAAASDAGDNVLMLKIAASTVLGLAGMYYLMAGKRDKSLKSMLLGCGLILLAALVF